MEYAKDELYTIKYIKNEDKQKIGVQERKRFIFLLIALGIAFSMVNFVLIFNFFSILCCIA